MGRTDARRGYRHGTVERRLTTGAGLRVITVPRGRVVTGAGTTEFRSALLPRYARRTREVDDGDTELLPRRSEQPPHPSAALQPLLGAAHLSKSAVSRVVSRLKALFASWQTRNLATERFAIVFLDGFHLKVRLARQSRRRARACGPRRHGHRRKTAGGLAPGGVRSGDLCGTPCCAISTTAASRPPCWSSLDGAAGLKQVRDVWPDVRVQRCTTHKWRNLETHCPVHARAELKRDYDRIIYADDGLAARAAYDRRASRSGPHCARRWRARSRKQGSRS